MMSEQSDDILTTNSIDDDFPKRVLGGILWGYPKLVDMCPLSILTDVRKQKIQEREKSTRPLPASHSESASDASEGRPTEIPGVGGITRGPSLPHSPPHEDQIFTNENMNPDIHGVYINEAENHPDDDSEQSVAQSVQVSI